MRQTVTNRSLKFGKPQNAGASAGQAPNEDVQVASDEDRRRHFRTDLRLKARYLSEDNSEYPCVVVNISAGGAMVKAKSTPEYDDKIILYIDGIGRFESTVVRSGKYGFAVRYHSRRAKTQRTADALIRVLNRGHHDQDRRIAPRIAVDNPVTITHEDGSQVDCAILDVSLTGASLALDPRPALGTEMIVGRMCARVVRRHELGVGVVFLGNADHMEDVIMRTAAPPRQLTHSTDDQSGIEVANTFGRKSTED